MTMVQFGNFCRGAWLTSSQLSSSDIDRIFLRAVRALPSTDHAAEVGKGAGKTLSTSSADGSDQSRGGGSLASALSAAGVKASSEWRKAKAAVSAVNKFAKAGGGKEMTQAQFVGALIRCAAHRYPEAEQSIAEKLTRLVKHQVEGHVLEELGLLEDDFNVRMRTRAMGAVLVKHAASLLEIFGAYAKADQRSAEARRALDTLNVLGAYDLSITSGSLYLVPSPRPYCLTSALLLPPLSASIICLHLADPELGGS